MNQTLNLLIGLAMGLNLLALGSSRLPAIIRTMAVQGVILGLLPLVIEPAFGWLMALVAFVTVVVKGFVIPTLLRRAMRTANIEREIHPFIGFVPSLLLGAVGTIAAMAATRALPLLVGRVKAISQVCGFLILENGIYLFGMLLIRSTPLLVESGILLDLIVAVFIFGIIVDRIQRAFDSLDTRKLTVLRE
jgi:hydrogenase-4 component E